MARNYEQFPDDENGDVLWDMAQDGDDLTKPREVDFSVIFPTEKAENENGVGSCVLAFSLKAPFCWVRS